MLRIANDNPAFNTGVSPEVLSSEADRSKPLAPAWADADYNGEIVSVSEISQEMLDEVRRLRQRLGVTEDLRTDLPYLLGFYDESRRHPVVVFLHKNQTLCAVVVFAELRYLGLGSGIYLVGDVVGDGAIIGDPAEYAIHLQAAVDILFRKRPFAHSVRACVGSSSADWPVTNRKGITSTVQRRSTRRRLKLAKTFPEMLMSFRKKTRRHLKKREQLESRGRTRFTPSLQPQEAISAMIALSVFSHPRRSLRQHYRRNDLLQNQEHAFAMGLQNGAGEWLSFISGWRSGGQTYIDLQMNNSRFAKDSISAVMRSYMLEQEIARGQTDVVFVGGTSILFQRYCEEDESCFDLLYRRKAILNRVAEGAARLLAPNTLVEYIYGSQSVCHNPSESTVED